MSKAKSLTELDKKIQEMALLNWPQFVALIGTDAINRAKVCLLRQNNANATYGEISVKLGITADQARYACNKCDEKNQS